MRHQAVSFRFDFAGATLRTSSRASTKQTITMVASDCRREAGEPGGDAADQRWRGEAEGATPTTWEGGDADRRQASLRPAAVTGAGSAGG
jgi:hypothetical protein